MPPAPKIWRIAHAETSLGWGGQEIRILTEMTVLRARGHHLMLAAPERSRVFAQARAVGFPVCALGEGKMSFPLSVVRLCRFLQREQVDILNPHSSRDGWIAGLAGRLAGVPFIVRSRHFDVPIASPAFSRLVYTALADHLITTSPKITAQFQAVFGLPDRRVSTVPTGIDPDVFSRTGAKASLSVPTDQVGWPLIGMVAVLRTAKGHVTLVQAARRLHDAGLPVRLVFVGDGPSRRPIDEQIVRQKLEHCVQFLGHREDVPDLLRRLDLLAIPSTHEGIPQIALQALATEVPVVGSNVGGIPSVIEDGRTGRLFPAGNDAALAEAIRAALTETAATRAMTAEGRRRVVERHSMTVMADALEAIYRRHLPG